MNSKTHRNRSDANAGKPRSLRQRALDLLNQNPGQLAQLERRDIKNLLHELQVHQIELEMQNQELRESRQELERTQAEYADLYDYAPLGYLSLDAAGRIRRLNLMAATMLGYPRPQLLGKYLSHFIDSADRSRFQRESRAAMDSGSQKAFELRLQQQGGDPAHIHIECLPAEPDVEQAAPSLRVAMTDISARVRVEEQLNISRRQLEAALHASHCGLWDWPDVTRDQAWWSPEFYELLGYENGALRPGFDSFRSLLHPRDREAVVEMINRHIHRGDAFDAEFRLRTRGGEYRWFRGTGRIIRRDRGGNHMAGLLQDVHDRHELNAAVHREKDKAEQADKEKSRFLAAASHDLRQPLQSLALYLGTLNGLNLSAEQADIVGKMRQSLQTMGQLLRTLLNISRLDAGIIEPEPVDIPVHELFADILVTNEPAAAIRGLELRVHQHACRVFCDRVLLQEILQNFVSNALNNTDRGGVLLACRRRGGKALLQVWDTGIGLPQDKLQALLDPPETKPGRHQHNETIRPGLGLSIVRQIAGLLDCRVEAASKPGRGSVFSVEVPLNGPDDMIPCGGQETRISEAEIASRYGHSLLLVDNDATILDACRSAAAAAGYRLATAGSRDEALAQVAGGFVPDIIICDLQLRRFPGTTVIRELREALGSNVPAILLTGDTSNPEAPARALGRCRVLFKPVEFEVIARTAEEMLNG